MKKMLIVAWREYWFNLRSRSFLFAAFGAPLLTVGIMTIVFGVLIKSEDNPESLGQIGYVEQSEVTNVFDRCSSSKESYKCAVDHVS